MKLLGYENFQRIWDERTRKGEDLTVFFPEIQDLDKKISLCRKEIALQERAVVTSDEDTAIFDELENLKSQREECLKIEFEKLAQNLDAQFRDGEFNVGLIEGPSRGAPENEKKTYTVGPKSPKNVKEFFTSRVVQDDLKRAFKIKMPSRKQQTLQFSQLLQDKVPCWALKTDVISFFEEIEPEAIFELLNQNSKVSGLSVRYVKALLEKYYQDFGEKKGLPRGIGVSTILSEVVMQEIDKKIALLPNLISYFRYVDDLALFFYPPEGNEEQEIQSKLDEAFAKFGLKLHREGKYQSVNFNKSGIGGPLDFLGYSFRVVQNGGRLEVQLTAGRKNKYLARIRKSFEAYEKYKDSAKRGRMNADDRDSADAFHTWLLIERLRFLSVNTKLSGNKSDTLVGIYFSNILLTNPSDLKFVDTEIRQLLESSSLAQEARQSIEKISFEQGFQNRTFLKYSSQRLKMLTKVWMDVQ